MSSPVITVSPDKRLKEVAELLAAGPRRARVVAVQLDEE
jgi:hypothetical protein